MELRNRTILITGGTSGIGFELARRLLERGNTVIVTGRDPARLAATRKALPRVRAIESDVADPRAIAALFATVSTEFPQLDLLVNNAGVMRKLDLQDPALDDATREIGINLGGPIRMVQQFLPLLKAQPRAAIVNVSSGLAFVPLAIAPVYSATKAALHSYTQSLRLQLRGTNVAVIELAPPGTETPLFRGDFTAADLRGVGFSRRKVEYVHDLAARVRGGELDLDRIATLPDEEAIAAISAVRGLGRWTAEIFLIFHLGRPDVISGGDLGIRKAIMVEDDLEKMPTPKQVEARAERWRPNRSLAGLYLWESLHSIPA